MVGPAALADPEGLSMEITAAAADEGFAVDQLQREIKDPQVTQVPEDHKV